MIGLFRFQSSMLDDLFVQLDEKFIERNRLYSLFIFTISGLFCVVGAEKRRSQTEVSL